ncbi:MAG: DUF4352 domain-containing protein [Clostridia bacterium]|nr:DUF4352 domain-containing protein [Clostridia bacterium]
MRIHCEFCGAAFDPRGKVACPGCGADFSTNRELAAALAGQEPGVEEAAQRENGSGESGYNAIPRQPYVPPQTAPTKKGLPGGCWAGLGCVVPAVIGLIFSVVSIIVGVIAAVNGTDDWEAPDPGEVVTYAAEEIAWGMESRYGDLFVTFRDYERRPELETADGETVYRVQVRITNDGEWDEVLYMDEFVWDGGSGSGAGRCEGEEDGELTLDRYDVSPGKTLTGWISFSVPDEERTVSIRFNNLLVPLREQGKDLKPYPEEKEPGSTETTEPETEPQTEPAV